MSRSFYLAAWLGFALLFVSATHYYIWARLVRDVALGPGWSRVGALVVVSLGLSIPMAFVVGRLFVGPAVRTTVWLAFVWLGIFFLLLMALGSVDILRLLGALVVRPLGPGWVDPERRLFLARLVGGAVVCGVFGVTGIAIRSALASPEVKRVSVSLSRLPRALSGLKVVQISDLHVSPTLGRAYVAGVVDKINAAQPDVVAITGDLVDGSVAALRHAVAPLRRIRARFGVFFVTGNHEYYAGADAWIAELSRMGIRVLHNACVEVGEGNATLYVAGIDDWTAHRFGSQHGADMAQALSGCDPSKEILLLAHQPKVIDEAAERGVGLVLSGHTHGGQIFPFGCFVRLQQPYIAGLHRHGASGTQIYVSRGTGYWGPPMRLRAPSEITLLELCAPGEDVRGA